MRPLRTIREILSGIVKWFGYVFFGIPEKSPAELRRHPVVEFFLFFIPGFPLILAWLALVAGGLFF
jgi:hypothetical protein